MLLIGGAIVIAAVLVSVSMNLYFQSGTAQLDMSRPSLQAVRAQALQNDRFEGFKAGGPLTKKDLEQFEKLYSEKTRDVKRSTESFYPESMSDTSLGVWAQ
jgi:hypothetical protein